jgi:hypothetical protein
MNTHYREVFYVRKGIIALAVLALFLAAGAAFAADVKEVYSENGMVSSAHELASKAGVEILQKGGNAIDAAIATMLALNVVEPNASGIGGGGFSTIRFAKTGEVVELDYREVAPLSATKDMYASEASKKAKESVLGGKSGEGRGEELLVVEGFFLPGNRTTVKDRQNGYCSGSQKEEKNKSAPERIKTPLPRRKGQSAACSPQDPVLLILLDRCNGYIISKKKAYSLLRHLMPSFLFARRMLTFRYHTTGGGCHGDFGKARGARRRSEIRRVLLVQRKRREAGRRGQHVPRRHLP